jgi:hypothetical protein
VFLNADVSAQKAMEFLDVFVQSSSATHFRVDNKQKTIANANSRWYTKYASLQ